MKLNKVYMLKLKQKSIVRVKTLLHVALRRYVMSKFKN